MARRQGRPGSGGKVTFHELKIEPKWLEALLEHGKAFEIRQLDRPFAVGDSLYLREWDPAQCRFTRHGAIATIAAIHTETHGLRDGYGLLHLERIRPAVFSLNVIEGEELNP